MGTAKLTRLCAALAPAFAMASGTAAPASPVSGDLAFDAVQAGAVFPGQFERFRADVSFDPAQPADCRFDVVIDTASVDTHEPQRDALLRGPDFFWVERYPEATFHGAGCRRQDHGFAVDGILELRGVRKPVNVSLVYTPGSIPRLSGTATLSRLDFGIGQGEWSATDWVGDQVIVRFDLRTAAAASDPPPAQPR